MKYCIIKINDTCLNVDCSSGDRMKICGLKGCEEKHSCNGYCRRHDSQVRRGKQPTLIKANAHRPAIIEGQIAKLPLGLSNEYALVDKEYAYLDKYNELAIERWGKFANLNKITSKELI